MNNAGAVRDAHNVVSLQERRLDRTVLRTYRKTADIDDIVAFLCTLTDGFDPQNPTAYNVPAQCQPTAATSAAR